MSPVSLSAPYLPQRSLSILRRLDTLWDKPAMAEPPNTIPSPFFDGPDREPDWTPSFLAGKHPWQHLLGSLTGMFYQYKAIQLPKDVIRLAQSMVKRSASRTKHRASFHLAHLPASRGKGNGPLDCDEKPSLLLDAERPGRPPVCTLLTTVRSYQHEASDFIRRTSARHALDEAIHALSLVHETEGTFLGVTCVENKFSRMICLGKFASPQLPLVCDTAGPILVLEVPERSPLVGRVTTFDAYCELDVQTNLAHTFVRKNPGRSRRPQELALDNTYDLRAVRRLQESWSDGIRIAAALPAETGLVSPPELSPAFESRVRHIVTTAQQVAAPALAL